MEDSGAATLFPRRPVTVAPGAVHVPDWLDAAARRRLVAAAREWARPPAGMRRIRMRGGGTMSVRTVCLGWHWRPYEYSRTADDGAPVKPMPGWLVELGAAALTAAYGDAGDYRPDVAVVNYYDRHAAMGLHRDAEERTEAPVVSLSVGDGCVFRLGRPDRRAGPYTDVELLSGDLFVFGGPSRRAYHGVTRILPDRTDPDCNLTSGRLNVTLRRFRP